MNLMICYRKKTLVSWKFCLLKKFSHLKSTTNATSHKLIAHKQVSYKNVFQDLVLQSFFESLSGDEQKAQESYLTILATNIVKSWLIFS